MEETRVTSQQGESTRSLLEAFLREEETSPGLLTTACQPWEWKEHDLWSIDLISSPLQLNYFLVDQAKLAWSWK